MVGASCTLNISFKHTTGARQSSRFILQFLYRCLFYERCQGGSAGLQYALVYQPSDDILWTEMTDLGLKNSFTQQPSDNCWPHKNDNQQRSWELVLAQVLTAQLSLTTIPCQEHIKILCDSKQKKSGCHTMLQPVAIIFMVTKCTWIKTTKTEGWSINRLSIWVRYLLLWTSRKKWEGLTYPVVWSVAL